MMRFWRRVPRRWERRRWMRLLRFRRRSRQCLAISKFLIVAGPKRSLPLSQSSPRLHHTNGGYRLIGSLAAKPRSNFLRRSSRQGRGNTSLNVVRSTLALPHGNEGLLGHHFASDVPRANYIRTPSGSCNNSHRQTRLNRHGISALS